MKPKTIEEKLTELKLINSELLEALQICIGQIDRSPNKYTRSDKINIAEKSIRKAINFNLKLKNE